MGRDLCGSFIFCFGVRFAGRRPSSGAGRGRLARAAWPTEFLGLLEYSIGGPRALAVSIVTNVLLFAAVGLAAGIASRRPSSLLVQLLPQRVGGEGLANRARGDPRHPAATPPRSAPRTR